MVFRLSKIKMIVCLAFELTLNLMNICIISIICRKAILKFFIFTIKARERKRNITGVDTNLHNLQITRYSYDLFVSQRRTYQRKIVARSVVTDLCHVLYKLANVEKFSDIHDTPSRLETTLCFWDTLLNALKRLA